MSQRGPSWLVTFLVIIRLRELSLLVNNCPLILKFVPPQCKNIIGCNFHLLYTCKNCSVYLIIVHEYFLYIFISVMKIKYTDMIIVEQINLVNIFLYYEMCIVIQKSVSNVHYNVFHVLHHILDYRLAIGPIQLDNRHSQGTIASRIYANQDENWFVGF